MLSLWKRHSVFNKAQWFGLLLFVCVGLFHNIIASKNLDIDDNHLIAPIIPYNHSTIDSKNRDVGPFDIQNVESLYYRHWLGTDALGRDTLAGVIHGTGIALKVCFWTTLFTLILVFVFGYLSGFLGDDRFQIPSNRLYWVSPAILIILFYFSYSGNLVLKLLWAALFFLALFMFLRKPKELNVERSISLPFDSIIVKLIEIFRTIPGLIIILVLLSFFSQPSLWNVIFVLGFIRWPSYTRIFRGEILNTKENDFVKSAIMSGMSEWKIFIKYIMPLSISPLIVALAFGLSSIILLESSLSFLGIGIPVDQVSWGSILKDARYDFNAWWLAVFPGLVIFLTILLFNSIGNSLSNLIQNLERD